MPFRRKLLIAAGAIVVLLVLGWTTDSPQYLMRRMMFSGDLEGYRVSFTADDMYAVENLSLRTRFSDFRVESGILVPGTTEVGTTVVLVLGKGEWTVRVPGEYTWENMDRESSEEPFQESFSSMYLRIHPGFYEEQTDARLEKIRDPQAFEKAEKIYKHKFWNSYHSNERALIPSMDIGTIDIESATWGRLQIHELGAVGSTFIPPMVRQWDYEGDPPWYMD